MSSIEPGSLDVEGGLHADGEPRPLEQPRLRQTLAKPRLLPAVEELLEGINARGRPEPVDPVRPRPATGCIATGVPGSRNAATTAAGSGAGGSLSRIRRASSATAASRTAPCSS